MEVHCLRQDQDRFIALGFHHDNNPEDGSPVVTLVDEEANYGHYERLPTDVPYFASHEAGFEYGPHFIACDGNRYVDVSGNAEGFIIGWNYEANEPDPKSLNQIREYLSVKATAQSLLDGQLLPD